MHEKLEKTFLSDIDLFSDEAEKGNEFKYQLRRRIREIKRTAKRRRKKKVRLAKDETDKPSNCQNHVIIELEKQATKDIKKNNKNNNIASSFLKIDNNDNKTALKNYIEKNLFISSNHEFSPGEEELIESWRLYSKTEMKLKKKTDNKYCFQKIIIYFFTLFFIIFITVLGSCFIVFNMFDILKSIKKSN
jgi:hypothetical protein